MTLETRQIAGVILILIYGAHMISTNNLLIITFLICFKSLHFNFEKTSA